jgi:hypothetical protein
VNNAAQSCFVIRRFAARTASITATGPLPENKWVAATASVGLVVPTLGATPQHFQSVTLSNAAQSANFG